MSGEGKTANIGVWCRPAKPCKRRSRTAWLALLIVIALTAAGIVPTLKGASSKLQESPSSESESGTSANQYGLNVYCFNAPGSTFGFGLTSITLFKWDVSKAADHAYRYVDTSVWYSDGEYHVTQREESVPRIPASGLAWDPDPDFGHSYYKGLGLRTWVGSCVSNNFTLILREDSGKELGNWTYRGQSVLYLGASSSASGMNIAFEDWKSGQWSPSDSLFFEFPSSTGLILKNASLDVMVMTPTIVEVPEFEPVLPLVAIVGLLLVIRGRNGWREKGSKD